MTSLHVAVLFGDENLTRSLLEEGFDVNTYDERLGTPLSIAVLKGYRSIVRLLHEHGADHNNEQFTSALIHSGIDELKLPEVTPVSSNVNESASGPKVRHDRSTFLCGGDGTADNSFREHQTWNTSAESIQEPRCSDGIIKTFYKRDGKLEENPTGTETRLNRYHVQITQDNQGGCSIVQIMELNEESEWFISEIRVRGEKLCRFISRVLWGYPGASHEPSKMTLATTTSTLDLDFIGLFHRSENYIKLCEEESDVATKGQAELLLQCLKPLWQLLYDLVEQAKITGLIKHEHLRFIFRPEQVVIFRSNSQSTNKLSAAKLKEVRMPYNPSKKVYDLELTIEMVNWSGFSFGYQRKHHIIEHYDGPRRMNTDMFPISYASDPDAIQKSLVKRGRKFESFRECSIMVRKEFKIQHRVIIDNYAYYRFEAHYVPEYFGLDDRSESRLSSPNRDPDEILPSAFDVGSSRFRSTSGELDESPRQLTDDECLICVPTMYGFDIQEKTWNEVDVDGLESVIWNIEAFKHLALDDNAKQLISAFTQRTQIKENKFDDFIAGKGKSLIVLLTGPPGVGKTFTVESVTELSRAPLYTLSAGDLGTDAESVERVLKKALEMCSHWKAVMLIDEADVFLEARKTHDLKHNEIVSVFLRLLEYYNGTLFLTTNRGETIDTAFMSRIDLLVTYPEWDRDTRLRVWLNFQERLRPYLDGIRRDGFEKLSAKIVNGREIKSVLKSAIILATSDGSPCVRFSHIEDVLEIRMRAK